MPPTCAQKPHTYAQRAHNTHSPTRLPLPLGRHPGLLPFGNSAFGTPQHNTTQHNTTQHNTTQHNTTQHNTTQHNTTQHNTTQHNTTQHNTTQHNTTQHNTTQHNTTQHNTLSTPQLYSRAGCRVRSPRRQGPGTANRRCTNSVGCAHVPVPSTIPRDPAAPSTGRLGPGNGQRPSVEDG